MVVSAIAYAAAGMPNTLAATPAPVALINHKIRTQPLALFDHGWGDLLGEDISERRQNEFVSVQIRVPPSGFANHPVELEVLGITGHGGQRQPLQERLAGRDHHLMIGFGTGKCQRHHRIQVTVRAERGEHDLHAVNALIAE